MPLVGKKIETTSANFASRARNNQLTVDKTLMIKKFWDGKEVSLILRPRRSGKSLNMSMLQYFFAEEVAGEKTSGLFDSFAIAKVDNGQFLKNHQGAYPVIAISFKDSKQETLESMFNNMKSLIVELYREHEALLLSGSLSESTKALVKRYLNGAIQASELGQSLKFLSEVLKTVTGKRVIILIDEYDSPLTFAYQYGFLESFSLFMRNMLSAALKDNPYLEKGLMTGILRVSKNEMLSGLNNLEIYSLLDKNYDRYYGFTEEEVNELVEQVGISHPLEEIRAFYNGYKIGDCTLYNPWSLMHYFDKQTLAPYWVRTSNDKLLKKLFLESNDDQKEMFSELMQGKIVNSRILTKTHYEELIEKPDALWTLLLFTGYLTVIDQKQDGIELLCQLKIPNKEISAQYEDIFLEWINETLGSKRYQSFLNNLLNGRVEKFTEILADYLMESLSFRDVKSEKRAESFYHGFTAGLVATIRDTHWVDSNKESGRGLYDLMITPKDVQNHLALILEFKQVKKTEDLDAMAEKALQQIKTLRYETELLRYSHITKILKVGLAFSGKEVRSVYKEEDLRTKKETPLLWTEPYCPESFEE